jgi:asparagine synthase (glutamine-hydrolysing)
MCGIFGLFNHETIQYSKNKENKENEKQNCSDFREFIYNAFNSAVHRGPDNSTFMCDNISHSYLGFHRLTINGSSNYYSSNQPICKNGIVLLCNGEIYNYKTLLNELGLSTYEKERHSGSDCEIIIDLYIKHGIETTVELLDGVFAFILIDMRCIGDKDNFAPKIIVARDPFGLRPLYWLKHNNDYTDGFIPELLGSCIPFGFASEMKQLSPVYQYLKSYNCDTHDTGVYKNTYNELLANSLEISPFPPGHYCVYTGSFIHTTNSYMQKDTAAFDNTVSWFIQPSSINLVKYYSFPHFRQLEHINSCHPVERIRNYLINAVEKRIHCTERPIACLLSGGIDSSLICGIIRSLIPKNAILETYSIGMEGASDKEYIEIVASHIKSNHTHVEASKNDFLNAIPTVVRLLETYDTTTVRASVGNYLISKYIKEHSDAKVIFNGDGSDELFGGYKYFLNCPDKYEFHKERKRLLTDIHYFDVLRSERSVSVNGLESRTPFLDKELVSYVMTLTQDLTYSFNNETSDETILKNAMCYPEYKACVFSAMKKTGIEKWMLRRAFINSDLIPKSILCRSKEAFSDGVSNQEESWYYTIQKHIVILIAENAEKQGDILRIKKSILLCEQEYNNDDNSCVYVQINDLLQDNWYNSIIKCYNNITSSTKNEHNSWMNDIMLKTEKWYYKTIYDFYYKHINTIPYYWMPKYSKETNDPSARTLHIYNSNNNARSDVVIDSSRHIEEQINKIKLTNFYNIFDMCN